MARILYGIHGSGHGHSMRGLTIARNLRDKHEFLFIAADDALSLLHPEFNVHVIPNLGSIFRDYQLKVWETITHSIPILLQRNKYIKEVMQVMEEFKPDVCITDLEYFVPIAAKRMGIPCLNLSHQHIITLCEHKLPKRMLWDFYLQGLTPRFLFTPQEQNLIVAFYNAPVRAGYNAKVCPPILRDAIINAKPRDDGHVLVYQSVSTHKHLVDFISKSKSRKYYVFGYQKNEEVKDNVHFMKKSEKAFLEVLEGASYVIQGGGHTLMTESLYLKKPILTFPIDSMIEQEFNALYLERLGIGMAADMYNIPEDLLQRFEDKLDLFKENMQKHSFCGNELVFGLVDEFACNGKLTFTN